MSEQNALKAIAPRELAVREALMFLGNNLFDGNDLECWETAYEGADEVSVAAQALVEVARAGLSAAEEREL